MGRESSGFKKRCAKILLKMGLSMILVISLLEKNSFGYRPFITEDAGVAGYGVFQLEHSWDHIQWRNGEREDIILLVPIYGFTKSFEMSAEIPYLLHNPEGGGSENGIGDINIVGKYLILDQSGWIPSFTFKGVVKMDSGDEERGLGSGYREYSIFAVATGQFEKLSIHTMGGFTINERKENDNIRNVTYQFGIALDYRIFEHLGIASEIYTFRHPDHEIKDNPVSLLVGLIYYLSEKIALDMGLRFGLNDTVPRWNSSMGITITF